MLEALEFKLAVALHRPEWVPMTPEHIEGGSHDDA